MKYSYVIIDAFEDDVQRLKGALTLFPDYKCMGTADNENSGLDLILRTTPDLVFLDVEIPGNHFNMSLFSIITELAKYTNNPPTFIVVTATKTYAIDAIRNDVLDYLLKPIDSFQLRKVLMRYEKKRTDQPQILCIKSHGDHKFVNVDDLIYLKADNNTTDLFLRDGEKITAFKTLKHFEQALPAHFTRIHHSYIINSKCVSRINFGKSTCTIDNASNLIPFSKSYRENVKHLKKSLDTGNMLYV
ncbi:LytR/AlgR family response regulator transcription factor [Spongiivirga citrea]|uniref:Response regulator n=1 Tax=Spongiivirga citrea TaxID=1481457 RepID=A0A6M0CGC3_9FLAO|nr:LytTR family DNA-binding domain-containing protein [Spongiivirga citrea]NER16905.1 response regulator [Spongiivirga citrea]